MSILTHTLDSFFARLSAERRSEPSPLEQEVTAWFLELREPLLRYTLSLGLSLADGEDIAQEVFLALFRHLRAGKPRDNLRGWIFRVAHNLALRRRMAIGNRTAPIEEHGFAVADPGPDPEALAGWHREHARLRAIFNALSERDRNCLTLRAEGLRYREIADALDMSLGAVALSLSRSLAKLAAEPARR